MLKITVDLYSGRPNPSWTLTDDAEVRGQLRDLDRKRQTLSAADAANGPALGRLRGLTIELQNDELAMDFGVTEPMYVPLTGEDTGGALRELAERLIATAQSESAQMDAGDLLADEGPVDVEMLKGMLGRGERRSGISATDSAGAGAGAAEDDGAAAALASCQIELSAYNPGFWNNDPNIRSKNNCYNYASNKRTDTFAQPGRGSGQIYTSIDCPAVSAAALRDGLHRRFVCFPQSEKPRYLVALVIAPGPDFRDFHWYRKNKEGFWSHKPGSTAARNVDNSGRLITDPATCDRGPYTHFCGYFYTCRSQRIR